MAGEPPREIGTRYDPITGFKWGALVLTVLTVFSTLSYWLLGLYYGRDWGVLDCLFMVVITLSTIGYADWLGIGDAPVAQLFTIGMAVIGVAMQAFVISNVTAMIVEGIFGDVLRRRRMEKKIARLTHHIIVCGAGANGAHCMEELLRTARPFVVIDHDADTLAHLTRELGPFLYLVGQADDDEVLKLAGVERAIGLVSSLDDDKLNLYVTLSARRLNPKLRIVSKVVDEYAAPKMLAAGADQIVSPSAIGGLRMVHELVRPSVVSFIDTMLRDPTQSFRFEELTVDPGSLVEDKTLATADLRSVGDVLVVAARPPDSEHYIYNPKAEFVLTAGITLVVLGRVRDLIELRGTFYNPDATLPPRGSGHWTRDQLTGGETSGPAP